MIIAVMELSPQPVRRADSAPPPHSLRDSREGKPLRLSNRIKPYMHHPAGRAHRPQLPPHRCRHPKVCCEPNMPLSGPRPSPHLVVACATACTSALHMFWPFCLQPASRQAALSLPTSRDPTLGTYSQKPPCESRLPTFGQLPPPDSCSITTPLCKSQFARQQLHAHDPDHALGRTQYCSHQ
jgi:hypothetical protein